jgi:hypothetical protein
MLAPLSVLIFLYRKHQRGKLFILGASVQVERPSWAPRSSVPLFEPPPAPLFSSRYGLLYEPYRSGAYWWEPYSVMRRMVIAACSVVFGTVIPLRNIGIVLVCLLILIAHLYVRPFRDELDNRMETTSLTILSLIAIILCGYQDSDMLPYWMQVIVGLLVVIPTVSFALFFITERAAYLHRNKQWRSSYCYRNTILPCSTTCSRACTDCCRPSSLPSSDHDILNNNDSLSDGSDGDNHTYAALQS